MKVKVKKLLILFALFTVSLTFAQVESVKGKLISSGEWLTIAGGECYCKRDAKWNNYRYGW